MRKIICDRCGAEITGDRIGYIAATWRSRSDDSFMQSSPYENADFCESCMKDIVSIIDFHVKVEVGEAVIDAALDAVEDPVEEEPVVQIQKTAVKKAVDKGKVGALAKAGWSTKKIADEMGVSPKRIRQILKELEEKKND